MSILEKTKIKSTSSYIILDGGKGRRIAMYDSVIVRFVENDKKMRYVITRTPKESMLPHSITVSWSTNQWNKGSQHRSYHSDEKFAQAIKRIEKRMEKAEDVWVGN